MIHRPRATATLLVALLLSAAAPAAAIDASDGTTSAATVAATTPLDTNLLRNSGFETVSVGVPIPGWTVEGDVHVETFGTRAWPYPAYGTKYHGGKRYLACGKDSGLVRQSVDLNGWGDRSFKLRARLMTDFGGTIGHRIRISIRVTGSGPDTYGEKLKVMDVTNHYKLSVANVRLPLWAEHIEVTVELMRKDGAATCKMVSDAVNLIVYRV